MTDAQLYAQLVRIGAAVDRAADEAAGQARRQFEAAFTPFERVMYIRLETIWLQDRITRAQQLTDPAQAAARLAELTLQVEALEVLANGT